MIAGLTEDNKPFLSGMDLIGAPVFAHDFVVAGTCTSNLHGMCEAMYRPNMVIDFHLFCRNKTPVSFPRSVISYAQNPEELFEALSQSLLAAVDRDALSGWGAVVHIMYVCTE